MIVFEEDFKVIKSIFYLFIYTVVYDVDDRVLYLWNRLSSIENNVSLERAHFVSSNLDGWGKIQSPIFNMAENIENLKHE